MPLSDVISNLKFSDIVSVLALIIAGISIFWNIYRDILLKPKLKVSVSIQKLVQRGNPTDFGLFILISAVNHGPGEIICESICACKRPFWRWIGKKNLFAFIIPPDDSNPMSSKLPKNLTVGERIQLLFPYEQDMFLARKPSKVGIQDSFGRIHWSDNKSLNLAISGYLEEFSAVAWNKQEADSSNKETEHV